jgi:Domain of unknown function (DUF4265)
VKIRVDIPQGDPVKIERVWALPLGNERYELRNTPFYAFDLNWGDVVQAKQLPDDVPRVANVIGRSGHKTLRITFVTDTSEELRRDVLTRLDGMATNYERGWGGLYALDSDRRRPTKTSATTCSTWSRGACLPTRQVPRQRKSSERWRGEAGPDCPIPSRLRRRKFLRNFS